MESGNCLTTVKVLATVGCCCRYLTQILPANLAPLTQWVSRRQHRDTNVLKWLQVSGLRCTIDYKWCQSSPRYPELYQRWWKMMTRDAKVLLNCCDDDALYLWWWRALPWPIFTLLYHRSCSTAVMMTRSTLAYLHAALPQVLLNCCDDTLYLWWWRALPWPIFTLLYHRSCSTAVMMTRSTCDDDALYPGLSSRCSTTGPAQLLWWWRALPVMMTRSTLAYLHAALPQVLLNCCDDDALYLWWWRALPWPIFTLLYHRSCSTAVMMTRSTCDDDALYPGLSSRCSTTGPAQLLWWWRALPVMMTRSTLAYLHAALPQV